MDDGAIADGILVWLVVAGGLLPRLGLPSPLPAVLLFAGLAATLVFGALRTTIKRWST